MMMPLLGQLIRSLRRVVSAVIVSPHFGCLAATSAPLDATRETAAKARITPSETSVAGAVRRRSLVSILSSLVWPRRGLRVSRRTYIQRAPRARAACQMGPEVASASRVKAGARIGERRAPPPALLPALVPGSGRAATASGSAEPHVLLEGDRVHGLRDLVDDQVGELGSLLAVQRL